MGMLFVLIVIQHVNNVMELIAFNVSKIDNLCLLINSYVDVFQQKLFPH